ncbi:hypothetical protein [Candidatus Liberibacter asiaticus]|uniref:hypothetical protein n=1 Tax=Liberibacter asiaticus TaxID=34021 RepID=UPI001AED47B7|nr:hypothetical protein [Candidatus Liberibacter asiaticus]
MFCYPLKTNAHCKGALKRGTLKTEGGTQKVRSKGVAKHHPLKTEGGIQKVRSKGAVKHRPP